MYSEEIKQLIEIRNYCIGVDEYLRIINTSPQITDIRYVPATDNFEMYTDDNYKFKTKVKARILS